jgi:anti-anti-sigma factor
MSAQSLSANNQSESKIVMLTRVTDVNAEKISEVWVMDNRHKAPPLGLSHRILPTGEAIADIGGELDAATADLAVSYVSELIDQHRGPTIADLTALRFCDAQGLSALLRMTRYAEQAGYPFRLASPSPMLVKLMAITGLDRRLLIARVPENITAEAGVRRLRYG